MDIRTTRSMIAFPAPFTLPGSDMVRPAGDYVLVIEEERLQGLSFEAYRRTAAFLEVGSDPRMPGRRELHPVTDGDLRAALGPVGAKALDSPAPPPKPGG